MGVLRATNIYFSVRKDVMWSPYFSDFPFHQARLYPSRYFPPSSGLLSVNVSSCFQFFFAYRVKKLLPSSIALPAFIGIALMSTCQGAIALYMTIAAFTTVFDAAG